MFKKRKVDKGSEKNCFAILPLEIKEIIMNLLDPKSLGNFFLVNKRTYRESEIIKISFVVGNGMIRDSVKAFFNQNKSQYDIIKGLLWGLMDWSLSDILLFNIRTSDPYMIKVKDKFPVSVLNDLIRLNYETTSRSDLVSWWSSTYTEFPRKKSKFYRLLRHHSSEIMQCVLSLNSRRFLDYEELFIIKTHDVKESDRGLVIKMFTAESILAPKLLRSLSKGESLLKNDDILNYFKSQQFINNVKDIINGGIRRHILSSMSRNINLFDVVNTNISIRTCRHEFVCLVMYFKSDKLM